MTSPLEQSLPADDTPPGDRPTNAARNTIEWVVIIAVALGAAFVIKTFLLQAFYIPSESMLPTLKVHDRVLVNKLSYHLHDVHRGDIVVFKRPPAEQSGPTEIKDLIKRVVGLPGDDVDLTQDGQVVVDGHVLNEPYLPKGTTTFKQSVTFPLHLGPHSYLVLGDNRNNSRDGRYFGPIDRNLIVGRAFVRVWPVGSLGLL